MRLSITIPGCLDGRHFSYVNYLSLADTISLEFIMPLASYSYRLSPVESLKH